MLHLGSWLRAGVVVVALRSPSICPAVGIIVIHTCFRFVSPCCSSAVLCAQWFIGAVPQFAIVADLRRACTATSPRDLASSAHKLPCSVRDELRVAAFGGSQPRKTGGGGVLHLTTSELLLVPFVQFDSRSAFLILRHSHQCVRQPGRQLTATEQQALQLTQRVRMQPAHSGQRAYVLG
jgi:hypothetical protein